MTVNHAWMLKGWLLAEHAPAAIMQAAEKVIESLTAAAGEIPPMFTTARPDATRLSEASLFVAPLGEAAVEGDTEAPATTTVAAKKSRKKYEFTPEQRAAASARMKAMQAAKSLAKRNPGAVPTGEVPAPSMGGA
jgi:hypothetical protein